MKYQVFSDNEWIYPDSEISTQNKAELHSARGADVCFQILTDHVLKDGDKMTASFDLAGCTAMVYQLLPAHVGEGFARHGFLKRVDVPDIDISLYSHTYGLKGRNISPRTRAFLDLMRERFPEAEFYV